MWNVFLGIVLTTFTGLLQTLIFIVTIFLVILKFKNLVLPLCSFLRKKVILERISSKDVKKY